MAEKNMSDKNRVIIMGGSGRSGTSYMAAALGRHPAVFTFNEVELKFIFEKDGLADLGSTLCETFSPNRAGVAIAHFRHMIAMLGEGSFGQVRLSEQGFFAGIIEAMNRFFDTIAPNGIAQPMDREDYNGAAKGFFSSVASLGLALKPGATHFLEKTPHNLLSPDTLSYLADEPLCLHVVRDPRGTAVSLLKQEWGPKTLDAASDWVKSYYEQWFRVRPRYDSLGLSLTEVRIEDVVAAPQDHSEKLLDAFGLDQIPVFADANGENLSARRGELDDEAKALLDAKLGAVAERLGYSPKFGT